MEQTGQQIFDFLSRYGYLIMLPLMILEGPVVTLIAAILARLGAFNIFIVLGLSIVGDVVGDVVLYRLGGRLGLPFVRRFGRFVGITEDRVLRMQKYFLRHGGGTIFTVKSTTGLCWATFFAAGMVRMDFRKFLKNSILGGLVWSGFLVAVGYFYGYLWAEIRDTIEWAGWLVSGVALATLAVIEFVKWLKARSMVSE